MLMTVHQIPPPSPSMREAPGCEMRRAGPRELRKDTRMDAQASSQARRIRDILADLMQRKARTRTKPVAHRTGGQAPSRPLQDHPGPIRCLLPKLCLASDQTAQLP